MQHRFATPFRDAGLPGLQQAELATYAAASRMQGVPRVRRVPRATQGGGFGDPDKQPWAWSVWVMIDGQWRQLISARGLPREWTSLDRVERWLRQQGFVAFEADGGHSTTLP